MFDILTVSLPAHWLPALINDDPAGFDDAEYTAYTRWCDDTAREFAPYHVSVDTDAEPYFARYHDAAEYGVLACTCIDVDLLIPKG